MRQAVTHFSMQVLLGVVHDGTNRSACKHALSFIYMISGSTSWKTTIHDAFDVGCMVRPVHKLPTSMSQ